MKIAVVACPRSGHTWFINQLKSYRADLSIDELEGWVVVGDWARPVFNNIKAKNLSDYDQVFVFVRDFDNWFASLLMKFRGRTEADFDKYVEMYENHCQLYADKRLTYVTYESFSTREYRKWVCDYRIKGRYNEHELHKVPPPNSGFDDKDYFNRRAQILASDLGNMYELLMKKYVKS